MKGRIVNYRRGVTTQTNDQMVVEVEGIKSRAEASNLAGKRIVWITATGREMIGKVGKPHGNKGAILVRFNKGLPGQALGTEVEIQ